jgi:hypothetical protein
MAGRVAEVAVYVEFATHVACVLDFPPVGHPVSDRTGAIRPLVSYPSNTPKGLNKVYP